MFYLEAKFTRPWNVRNVDFPPNQWRKLGSSRSLKELQVQICYLQHQFYTLGIDHVRSNFRITDKTRRTVCESK